MLIVNQDKNTVINFKSINYIDIQPNEQVFDIEINYNNNMFADIATYESEKRAQEVLNEVINKYLEYASIKNSIGDVKQVYSLPKVYIMPEK